MMVWLMIFHNIQVWVSVTMSVFYLLFRAVQIWFQLATPSLTGDSNGNKIESDASKATIFKQFLLVSYFMKAVLTFHLLQLIALFHPYVKLMFHLLLFIASQ